ncbi:MAG TPA: hypothetical protein GXX51_01025 [Firmicutes bacterium]|nr:hypothetical protein [Bacillota bacterium]
MLTQWACDFCGRQFWTESSEEGSDGNNVPYFCPWCGHNLSEEEEDEFERRIENIRRLIRRRGKE